MKLLLTALSGSREGKVFTIEANESITFGRTSLSNWSFEDDGHMSSVHFEVSNLGDRAEVRDCNSTNGTWLNNHKIAHETLREGDRIRAGKTILTVEFSLDLVPADLVSEELDKTQAPSLPPFADISDFENMEADSPPPVVERKPEPARTPQEVSAATGATPVRQRAINPFDSIDFSDFKTDPTNGAGIDSPSADSDNRYGGPLAESSVFVPLAPTKSNHKLLTRRTTQEAANSFAIVLDSLATQWSMQLVVHFQKIRIDTPLDCASQPIFKGAKDPALFPVRMIWNEANSSVLIPLMPRLCRADACIAFLGHSASLIGDQLEIALKQGVEGYSEPDGFLPYYWPSMLLSMVDARGASVCQSLFGGKIAGAIMCTPRNRFEIIAVADDSLSEALVESQFKTC